MASNGNYKTIAVLGPNGVYMSHCTWKKASTLLCSGRADRVDATTIRLKETKKTRKEVMRKIIEKSGRRCYICGEVIPETDCATIDHVIPKSRDRFSDTYENMQCCCVRCNSDKKNMMPIEYVRHILDNREQYDYLSDERIEYLAEEFIAYQKYFSKEKHQKKSRRRGRR